MEEQLLDEVSAGSAEGVLNNNQRAKNVMIIFAVLIVVELLVMYFLNSQKNLLETVMNGGEISVEEADANDRNLVLINGLSSLVHIGCAILFLMWMRRAYANVNRMGIKTDSKDSEAIWSWFIPFYNFYKPVSMISEMWKKTQQGLKNLKPSFVVNNSVAVIGIWWASYIGSSIFSSVAGIMQREAVQNFDIQGMVDGTQMTFNATLISVVAAALCILVVKKINDVEKQLINS